MRIDPEVAAAIAAGRAVVALESTIISHGLPRPSNLRVAREIEGAVRAGGAVPATIAIVEGEARIGLDDAALARIAESADVVKASVRDLAVIAAAGGDGATTVAATAHLATRAGIGVFATGGLGGVHREARDTWDESADLTTLGRTPILVVCAGVKSILDVPATLERLETLNIAVLGFRTDRFPGFYLADSGYPLPWRVESAGEVAAVLHARRDLGTDQFGVLLANPISTGDELDRFPGFYLADSGYPLPWRVESAGEVAAVLHARRDLGTEQFGVLLANPISTGDELDRALHERTLTDGLAAAASANVVGKDVTPFLLGYFNDHTDGAALAANVALVLSNARLAAEVAVEFARMDRTGR